MFKHEKQLFHPVAVERPNPHYAALMQEQLGGGNVGDDPEIAALHQHVVRPRPQARDRAEQRRIIAYQRRRRKDQRPEGKGRPPPQKRGTRSLSRN